MPTSKTDNVSADPNPPPRIVPAGTTGTKDSDTAVFITNRNGGTHEVPENWVTEDAVGGILLRGEPGKARWATDDEIKAYTAEFRPAS